MNNFKQKYAEGLPYWKTSQAESLPIQEAKNAIENNGGVIEGSGDLMMDGNTVFFIQFSMQGNSFRYIEPVMQSKTKNIKAARIQAAVSLKHTIKARVNEAVRHGARRAFIGEMLLPDGSTIQQKTNPELMQIFSRIAPQNALVSGDVVEGEIV